MIRLFIGYDEREPAAYHTCVDSIIRHSSEPLSITPLALNNFEHFYDEVHTDGSNAFIYSRFLVPYLCGFKGDAIYLDGDMVVLSDIYDLWQLRDPFMAVQVVKHDYKTTAAAKYLGNINEDYPRKNWSSVMVWNCGHFGNGRLTPQSVTRMSGAELHRFSFLRDDFVGDLPITWNWLETEYEPNDNVDLIHYTLGLPCFSEYARTVQAGHWHKAYLKAIGAKNETARDIVSRALGDTNV